MPRTPLIVFPAGYRQSPAFSRRLTSSITARPAMQKSTPLIMLRHIVPPSTIGNWTKHSRLWVPITDSKRLRGDRPADIAGCSCQRLTIRRRSLSMGIKIGSFPFSNPS